MKLVLQAEHRLLAFRPNTTTKNSLEVELWTTISERADESTKFKKIMESKGVTVWIYDDNVLATVPSETWAPVGCLILKENWDSYTEVEFSVVSKPFLGRGIGQLMYEATLKHLGHLASSDSLSKGSSALWCRLVTKHKGHLVIPAENSPTGKKIKVKVVDFVKKGSIMYPVVETPSGRKDLKQLMKQGRDYESQSAAESAFYLIEA